MCSRGFDNCVTGVKIGTQRDVIVKTVGDGAQKRGLLLKAKTLYRQSFLRIYGEC